MRSRICIILTATLAVVCITSCESPTNNTEEWRDCYSVYSRNSKTIPVEYNGSTVHDLTATVFVKDSMGCGNESKSSTLYWSGLFYNNSDSLQRVTVVLQTSLNGTTVTSKPQTFYVHSYSSAQHLFDDIESPTTSLASARVLLTSVEKFPALTNNLFYDYERINSSGSPWEVYVTREEYTSGTSNLKNFVKMGRWVNNGVTYYVMPNHLYDQAAERPASLKKIGDSIIVDNGRSANGMAFPIRIVWNYSEIAWKNFGVSESNVNVLFTTKVSRRNIDGKSETSSSSAWVGREDYFSSSSKFSIDDKNPVGSAVISYKLQGSVYKNISAIICPTTTQSKLNPYNEASLQFSISE